MVEKEVITAHVVVAIILACLPYYLLVPILACLTYESYWASLIVATLRARTETLLKPKIGNRRNSIDDWVKGHYDTLKRIVRANSEASLNT